MLPRLGLTCRCGVALQPVRWKETRLLWCCGNLRLPSSLKCRVATGNQALESETRCKLVIEFLNDNDKARVWHQFKITTAQRLVDLCKLAFRQPVAFNVEIFEDMIRCLHSYDTNMETEYAAGTKKRKQNALPLPAPKKRKTKITKRKLDPFPAKGQSQLNDFRSIVVITHRSDSLERKLEIEREERRKWVEEHCKLCRCEMPRYVEKKTVKELDREGNKNKNAGRNYWACNECRFFVWEDVVYEFYKKFN